MNFQTRGLLYPALSHSSFHIKRDLLPRQFKLPDDVDSAMAQEVPKQQSLELERAALARYEKLQAEAVLPVTTGGGGAVAEAKTADGAFAHQGAMKPPMSPRSAQRESTLADFMGITSSTEAVARQLLQTHNWELEASIHAYYER